ncbi:TonB-dependent siderophore receptor [Ancylobacter oerskovii]|uniref:TonB-dependent siderophore receptor n=1 Tax=Ancylobacter oerskovii TaxID=459519 RepID=A0ABW4YVV6_9HYPH|nr:TonB-dependent siderophore receptor [Ancylobacter oerskovii]MBS7544134.1 TonB-dependent siderophore receptor [Ancylobacter oerskovii]
MRRTADGSAGVVRAGRRARSALLVSLMMSSALIAVPLTVTPARAQGAAVAARTNFDIPAQPLSRALIAFSHAAGLQLFFDAGLVRGKNSPGVRGSLTHAEALNQLLAGSGLAYRISGNTLTITAPAAATGSSPDGAIELGTIQVEGQQNPFGPVDGYLATTTSSATGVATPILETPQSISVVTADQIKDQNATSLTDTLLYTPGVVAQSGAFSRMVDDLMLRGFNIADGASGMLRDGMQFQSNVYGGGQEPYGLERVEVLRGPASILYGQMTPGGVVNAISKRPTEETLREVNLEYGTYDTTQVSADFGGKLNEDGTLTYRLTGLYRDGENWVEDTPDDKVYIAPALTWKPDEDTSLTLLASYQHVNTRFATPLQYDDVSTGNIPRNAFLGIEGFDTYQGDVYTTAALFEHRFDNGIVFRSNNRYYAADVNWDYMIGNLAPLAATGGLLARLAQARDDSSYGVTSANSLEFTFDALGAGHTVLAGFDYYLRSYDTHRYRASSYSLLDLDTGVSIGGPNVNYAIDRGSDTLASQYGVFIQDQIKFGDHWVLLVGGRNDWADSSTTSYQTGVETTQDDSAFTGRAGLVYLFDSGLAPYVSVSQSFQPQAGLNYATGDALEPSKGLQYEAGVRYQPAGQNLLLSAAVYDIKQTNVVTYDALGYSYQQGEVHSRGFEFEARGEVGRLELIAAYSYTDATVTESADPTEIGQQVALVPRNAASFWANYALDDLGLRGVKIGAGVRYIGTTYLTDSDFDVPAYTLVDAMASVDLGAYNPKLAGTTLKVNANNLFDKQYYTCVSTDGCRYGEPATVIATLTYKW